MILFLSFLCAALYLCGYVLTLYLCNAVARVFMTSFNKYATAIIAVFWPLTVVYIMYHTFRKKK